MGARRNGVALTGMAFAGLVMSAAAVVMAISGQSSSARSVHVAHVQGRFATQLAESAVEECLADFDRAFGARVPKGTFRARLMSAANGAIAPGSAVAGVPSWSYAPERTLALLKELKTSMELTPVSLTPLYYNVPGNVGEIELSAGVSWSITRDRVVYRRVRLRCYITADGDGSIRVNPVGTQSVVDRSAS